MWLSTHWCLCVGILHNRQAKNHLLCPKKNQSKKNWKKKTKDSSAQLALNGKQSTAMAATTMELHRSPVFRLRSEKLMAFCWMPGMFGWKVVQLLAWLFGRCQAAPAGKWNQIEEKIRKDQKWQLNCITAVARDSHVRRSSSGKDINCEEVLKMA